jgi:hypothetical protein
VKVASIGVDGGDSAVETETVIDMNADAEGDLFAVG